MLTDIITLSQNTSTTLLLSVSAVLILVAIGSFAGQIKPRFAVFLFFVCSFAYAAIVSVTKYEPAIPYIQLTVVLFFLAVAVASAAAGIFAEFETTAAKSNKQEVKEPEEK